MGGCNGSYQECKSSHHASRPRGTSIPRLCLPTGRCEWCGQAWCYVSDSDCPGALPTDFFANHTHVADELWYSYAQCDSVDYFTSDEEQASFDSPCSGGGETGDAGAGYCEAGQRGPLCEACTARGFYYDEDARRCVACPESSSAGLLALYAPTYPARRGPSRW